MTKEELKQKAQLNWETIEKIEWHDLVKNPEDLPDSCESVAVKTYDGEFYVACYSNGEWRFKDIQYNPVIAWKEI